MPSSIRITTAFKDACIDLLTELSTRAEPYALEVGYHVVASWASALLKNPQRLAASVIAAYYEFGTYPVNERWLAALDELLQYGGESTDDFVVTVCRYYLFNLPQIEEILWQQYGDLRRKVTLETGRQLPESWGEWDGPVRAFLNLFEGHLRREDTTYDLLFSAPEARELMDISTRRMLPPGEVPQLTIAPVAVDDTVALFTYLAWCLEQHGRLEAGSTHVGEQVGLRLPDIFVPRRLRPADDRPRMHGYVRYQLIAHRQRTSRERAPPRAMNASQDQDPPLGPVLQVLERAIRLLVLGGPGEGKTTLLRHLIFQHASQLLKEQDESPLGQRALRLSHRVPIYVHLADYAENGDSDRESVLDYALRALEDDLRDPNVTPVLRRLLDDGQCLILLDGLDAVIADDQRRKVAARVGQFAERWCADSGANRVLVASRPAGYWSAPLPGFETCALAEFDRNEISQALLRWSLATERARRPMLTDDALQRQSEKLTMGVLQVIFSDDSLRAMAVNPLLLRVMVEHHQERAYFSPRRVGLLQAAADAAIRDWRLARGPTQSPQVQEAEATYLLSHLAYWLHDERPSGTASEMELVRRLSDVWLENHPQAGKNDAHEAIADFVAKVRHHGGLLAEVRPRRYGFVHPSVREYFAARYMVTHYRLAAERIRRKLHDPRWEEVVRLAVGLKALDSPRDASDLLESAVLARPSNGREAFPPSPFEDVLRRDLLFAASLLADGVEADPTLMRSIVQQVVDLWIHGDRDSVGRFDACLNQARLLLTALDGTAAGQMALSHALTHAGDDRAPVRTSLADALTFWPSQSDVAIETLVGMGRDTSAIVRRAVAEALGRMEALTPDAHYLLLSMVNDPDIPVRDVARRALQSAGPVPPEAMRLWVNLLHDDNPGRRQLGARVLQRVGSLPPVVVGELLALLSDEDERVRSTVASTLAEVDTLPNDALLAICHAIDRAQPDVRVAGIEALARPVELPNDVIAQLIGWSQESDARCRLAATRALDMCRNREDPVIDALMDRAGDTALHVRQLAIEALGRKGAGNRRVAHMLQHYASETEGGVRISAARAFGYIEELSPEAESTLADLVQDFHIGVREAAMDAVARLGKPYEKLLPRLLNLAGGDSPEETALAARALAALDQLPINALVVLVNLLSAQPDALAEPIMDCLRRHSPLPAEVIHPLINLARNASPEIRSLAIEVLAQSVHAVPGVLDELLQLASDPDSRVRAEAIASLSYARDLSDHALDTLFDMLDGEPLPVRRAAAVTLARLSRTLPYLAWDDRRLEALADRLYNLLNELPARASWEPDVAGQNAVYEALRWLAVRYGPEL